MKSFDSLWKIFLFLTVFQSGERLKAKIRKVTRSKLYFASYSMGTRLMVFAPGQKLATICVSVPSIGLGATQQQFSTCFDLYMSWLFLATLKTRAA